MRYYIFCATLLLSSKFLAQQQPVFKKEKICVIGTGYVGLVTGIGLAHIGHDITCVDIDAKKIANLKNNIIPIYEPGLKELLIPAVKKRDNSKQSLRFNTSIDHEIQANDIIYIAVGTPMSDEGHADLRAIEATLNNIAKNITTKKIICMKSTVPVGTCAHAKQTLIKKGVNPLLFDIVSNPEFLKEGTAVEDFLHGDRIIIGCENKGAGERIKNLYLPLINNGMKYLITNLESSELTKYASNGILATKIAFINEIAQLCNKVHANVQDVATGMGMDKRIGNKFLNPGPGFGGSCFPKDTKALEATMKKNNLDAHIVRTIFKSNEQHKQVILDRINTALENKENVAILGLTFKANTDDIRYSFAIDLIENLQKKNKNIKAYDPQGTDNMKQLFPNVTYCTSKEDAIKNADLIVIVTEWDEFKTLDLKTCAELCRTKCIVDTRNIIKTDELKRHNFTYFNIGNIHSPNY